ncbi:hypothetical protein [Paenibacillus sp. S-12]|uniref:hypothetical protein n=1 Tax=Paenibacillus sp. S-12 TaxID=3031371 RepID=UPI00259FF9A8|nr:hypothetical protein [Paenibacillus sp. S-12]
MPLCKHWMISSTGRGMAGGSTVAACTAISLAWQFRINVLLIHAKGRGEGVERLFPPSIDLVGEAGIGGRLTTPNGWSALVRMLKNHQVDEESISTYMTSVMSRLDILPGYESGEMEDMLNADLILHVQRLVSKRYDLVLWDINEQDFISLKLTGNMHLHGTIAVISQVRSEIHNAMENISKRADAFVIGQYDTNVRLNPINVKRMYFLHQPIFAMPYSSAYRNAADDRMLIDWYLRQSLRQDRGKRSPFISEHEKLCRYILEVSGYHPGRSRKAGG